MHIKIANKQAFNLQKNMQNTKEDTVFNKQKKTRGETVYCAKIV